uniref:Uncharacterized protein n=1 Tax=Lotharella globosa TaxID=91324 RepID=A0A7S3ZC23_9EUKA
MCSATWATMLVLTIIAEESEATPLKSSRTILESTVPESSQSELLFFSAPSSDGGRKSMLNGTDQRNFALQAPSAAKTPDFSVPEDSQSEALFFSPAVLRASSPGDSQSDVNEPWELSHAIKAGISFLTATLALVASGSKFDSSAELPHYRNIRVATFGLSSLCTALFLWMAVSNIPWEAFNFLVLLIAGCQSAVIYYFLHLTCVDTLSPSVFRERVNVPVDLILSLLTATAMVGYAASLILILVYNEVRWNQVRYYVHAGTMFGASFLVLVVYIRTLNVMKKAGEHGFEESKTDEGEEVPSISRRETSERSYYHKACSLYARIYIVFPLVLAGAIGLLLFGISSSMMDESASNFYSNAYEGDYNPGDDAVMYTLPVLNAFFLVGSVVCK